MLKTLQLLTIYFLLFATSAFANSGISAPADGGENYGRGDGLLMFRGNPMRNYYGSGPLPMTQPRVKWRYPDKPMCASSCVGSSCSQWCGTGWTGQPAIREYSNGVTEVIFGAYDRQVHFVNAETGKPTRKPFPTKDIIKGSVTLDPDGYPLLYFGSRDNKYRIVALDSSEPRELWSMDGNDAKPRVWNDDWDGNAIILQDHLIVGGENSWFYIIKLNRRLGTDGKVSVAPKKIFEFPSFPPEIKLLAGDQMTSIESSPVIYKDRVYFANSAGYVVGFDLSKIKEGKVDKVFEFWAGDDIDGTPVVDNDGFLYIAVELELDGIRKSSKSAQQVKNVGQLIKLDPYKPSLPLKDQVRPAAQHPSIVWKQDIPAVGGKGGIWSTPALDLKNQVIYVTTHPGALKSFDMRTGQELWSHKLGFHEWSSPVLVDGYLLVGRCQKTGLELFDVRSPFQPKSVWATSEPKGCVESTPGVWRGNFYVGSRDGYFYGFGK